MNADTSTKSFSIRKDSFSNRFYSLFYDRNINHQTPNFCDWAWMYIFAVLSLPFTWITLWKRFSSAYDNGAKLITRIIIGFMAQFLIGFYILGLVYRTRGTLEFTGVIAVFTLAIFLFAFGMAKLIIWASNQPEKKSIIGETWKSYKEKYCPKIEWK